ncbi:alpha,alpha-trehalase ath1 [Scheffersomyces spartinae]|uniref:alpha,alpha-trehalase n=1 Tax=Scheffersomyces spartinae TaxID=45513 RepID=A0A9P7VD18_9ASCO|nr:alpha,alpha-trehalase ath1 [Scheffersomyces spartinae]KAG7195590.1 alpha,alpha-trehalase ath1 [Scheffersomyces spartinae]
MSIGLLLLFIVIIHLGFLSNEQGFGFVKAYPVNWKGLWSLKSSSLTTLDPTRKDRDYYVNLAESLENQLLFQDIKNSKGAYYDLEDNTVGTVHFNPFHQYQSQPYVANGYIGSRIPNVGHGFAYDTLSNNSDANPEDIVNGWPLFNQRYAGAFVAGFFDIEKRLNGTNFPELLENGYESSFSAVPQWTTLEVSALLDGEHYRLSPNSSSLELGPILNYSQKASLDNGVVTTEFIWLDALKVKYSVLAHREVANLGIVSLYMENLGNSLLELKVLDILAIETAQRCHFKSVDGDKEKGIYIAFQPHEIDYVDGIISSKLSLENITIAKTNHSVSQSSKISLKAYDDIEIFKTVGIVTSDYDSSLNSVDKLVSYARNISNIIEPIKDLYQIHLNAWESLIGEAPLIIFKDDLLLSMAARASIYHLLANTRSDAQGVTAALGVGGLSSDSYAGMVFWDADLWMYHALLPFSPSHAKSIVNYRLHTREQAQKNVPKGYSGAVYPWTSGRFGNCTATGPCLDYEYHINHAVVQASWNLYLSGAADDNFLRDVTMPMINDAATFLSTYVTKINVTDNSYWTFNMTDPDEYANHINNGAYTNGGISAITQWANTIRKHFQNDTIEIFEDISKKIEIPQSDNKDNITLEYTGMNGTVEVKQADVIMLTYPLENVLIDDEQALRNMQFYSQKQVSYGPAMTFPIFSIVSSKLSQVGCSSQSYLHRSVQPYLRAPFAQFSEQSNDNYLTNGGTHPAFPFLTGHGGFVQAIVQGLTGFRYSYDTDSSGKILRHLEIDPVSLPLFGGDLSINGLVYMNYSLAFDIKDSMLTVTNNGPISPHVSDKTITIKVSERNEYNGTYKLAKSHQLSVPLFTPQRNVNDSICECELAEFRAITESVYGDSPLLINDGDNFTHWQAKHSDSSAKLLVDLKLVTEVKGAYINWGDKPPLKYELQSLSSSYRSSFPDSTALQRNVDFANTNKQLYNEYEVFDSITKAHVNITAPFDPNTVDEVAIVKRFNTTKVSFQDPVSSRYLLLTFDGVHEKDSPDNGGAKVFEMVLF